MRRISNKKGAPCGTPLLCGIILEWLGSAGTARLYLVFMGVPFVCLKNMGTYTVHCLYAPMREK